MQTYWFEGREYNMDVSRLKQRPKEDIYVWNIKNHWLKRGKEKRNDLIRYVHYSLEKCGRQVPQYESDVTLWSGTRMWINDIGFDLAFMPEYIPALKEGWRVWRAFDYGTHGTWGTYCEAHMLKTMCHATCLAYVNEWRLFARNLHGKNPAWMDDMLKELGAA